MAALLGRTIAEVEDGMSGTELAEWIAFERQYDLPDGFFLGSVAWQMWGGRGSKLGDSVPYFRRRPRAQTADEQRAILAGFRATAGRPEGQG